MKTGSEQATLADELWDLGHKQEAMRMYRLAAAKLRGEADLATDAGVKQHLLSRAAMVQEALEMGE